MKIFNPLKKIQENILKAVNYQIQYQVDLIYQAAKK